MQIYKQFDQAALDSQYNLRAQVPDFAVYLDRCDLYSRQTENELSSIKDLSYGSLPREKLDIYPSLNPFSKTLVFIHGGYWQRFGKRDFQFIAKAFHDCDVTTVLIEYPLAPDVSMDQIVSSCRKSLCWLGDHLAEFNGDPGQIYIAGHSAGAHLSAMLLTTEWKQYNLPADLIKGACLISGLFDLKPIFLSYINQVLNMSMEEAERNSPIHLSPVVSCPLSVIVGADETKEFLDQSRDLYESWRSKVPAEIIEIERQNHYSILETVLDQESPLHRSMARLMKLGND